MTIAPSAPTTAPAVAGLDPQHQTIRHRLDTATMALLQTRDQVVRALDKHLAELHSLRRALAEADQVAVLNAHGITNPTEASHNPAPASRPLTPVFSQPQQAQIAALQQPSAPPAWSTQPGMPMQSMELPPLPALNQPNPPSTVLNALQGLQDILLQKAPLTPPPMPMNQVFPESLPDMVQVHEPAPPAAPQPMQFAAPQAPVVIAPPPAPAQPPAAASAPRSPFEVAMLGAPPVAMQPQQMVNTLSPMMEQPSQAQTLMQLPPPPMAQVATLPPQVMAPPAQPQPMAREVSGIDPKLEQATLEDLNAALAFAFSQASTPSHPMMGNSMTSVLSNSQQQRTSPAAQQWQLPPRH